MNNREPQLDIVISDAVRTPVGRMGGALAPLTAAELATLTLRALVERTGLGEGDVDDVILGNGYASGEAPAIGRIAALNAGLGTGVPGLQIDRRCGSGLQAVLYAAGQVATGAASVIVAGGAESMSNVEHYALGLRTGVRQGGIALMDRLDRARETAGGTAHPIGGGMIETAENLRREYRIGREEQDELALRSHQRAVAAHEAGRFADEMIAVTVPGKRGRPDVVVDRDEHPRADITGETLAASSTDPLEGRCRIHRHRGQRFRSERRRRDVRRLHPHGGRKARSDTAARAAILGGDRLPPGSHGYRTRDRDGRRAEAGRPHPR